MQIRLNTDINLNNEDGTINTILKGWIIGDVVSVSACPKDPNLRSIQIESAPTPTAGESNPEIVYQYLFLPADAFSIEEAPGWQGTARRIEERSREAKAA